MSGLIENMSREELIKHLHEMVFYGKQMRDRQKTYFNTGRNATNLSLSKQAESTFDQKMRLMENKGFGTPPAEGPKQGTLI